MKTVFVEPNWGQNMTTQQKNNSVTRP